MMEEMDNNCLCKIFKALSDANRLQILELLIEEEHCGCELLAKLSIGQSTLSHHMKILTEAGLVDGKRKGKWTHYSLNEQGFKEAKELISQISKSLKVQEG